MAVRRSARIQDKSVPSTPVQKMTPVQKRTPIRKMTPCAGVFGPGELGTKGKAGKGVKEMNFEKAGSRGEMICGGVLGPGELGTKGKTGKGVKEMNFEKAGSRGEMICGGVLGPGELGTKGKAEKGVGGVKIGKAEEGGKASSGEDVAGAKSSEDNSHTMIEALRKFKEGEEGSLLWDQLGMEDSLFSFAISLHKFLLRSALVDTDSKVAAGEDRAGDGVLYLRSKGKAAPKASTTTQNPWEIGSVSEARAWAGRKMSERHKEIYRRWETYQETLLSRIPEQLAEVRAESSSETEKIRRLEKEMKAAQSNVANLELWVEEYYERLRDEKRRWMMANKTEIFRLLCNMDEEPRMMRSLLDIGEAIFLDPFKVERRGDIIHVIEKRRVKEGWGLETKEIEDIFKVNTVISPENGGMRYREFGRGIWPAQYIPLEDDDTWEKSFEKMLLQKTRSS